MILSNIFLAILARPKLAPSGLKIVGGYTIDITEAPYQVSLQYYNSHICGGSIIDEKWIMTAAHCTDGSKAENFQVRVGSAQYSKNGELIKVKRIEQHELFNYFDIDYDYSLLELQTPITFDDNKQKIKLPEQDEPVLDGTLCTVSGWGNTQVK